MIILRLYRRKAEKKNLKLLLNKSNLKVVKVNLISNLIMLNSNRSFTRHFCNKSQTKRNGRCIELSEADVAYTRNNRLDRGAIVIYFARLQDDVGLN